MESFTDEMKRIVAEVRDELSNGNSNPYSGIKGSQLRIPQHFASEFVAGARYEASQLINDFYIATGCSRYAWPLLSANIARKYHAGNCGENAAVAFAKMTEQSDEWHQIPYYLCHALGGADHAFLVVKNALINEVFDELLLVSEESYIVDPWADQVIYCIEDDNDFDNWRRLSGMEHIPIGLDVAVLTQQDFEEAVRINNMAKEYVQEYVEESMEL